MKHFLILLALLCSFTSRAEYKDPDHVRDVLNSGYGAIANLGTQLIDKKVQVIRGTYDFAVLGGAVGAVNLKDMDGLDVKIPKNAIIVDCLIDVLTAPTSGGSATISLGTNQSSSTVDLKAATAIASYSGLVACTPVGTAATAIKITAETTPKATVAVAALTAGKMNVLLQYIISK